MDLRPLNPYYRAPSTWSARTLLLADSGTYSYPYTWIEPVTDRTQEDVEHAAELIAIAWDDMTAEQQEEYISGLKGCMNRNDFERIENNIQILLDVLEIDSTSYVGEVPEFPTQEYFSKMQSNVAAIRSGYLIHTDTPEVPALPFNTWQKINDIEKILADVYEIIAAQFNYYTGTEIYTGDSTGLIL